jgi:hypothetical protein
MTLYFVQFTDKTTLGSSSILGIKVSYDRALQWDTQGETRSPRRPIPTSLPLSTSEPAPIPSRTF